MPGDFAFDLKAMRARDEINDALGVMQNQRMNMPNMGYQPMPQGPTPSMNMQADQRMQMANVNMPMGGGVSANAQFGGGQNMPYGMQNMGVNYNAPSGFGAGLSYSPQQKSIGANLRVPFRKGGLAMAEGGDVSDEIVVEGRRPASVVGFDLNRLVGESGGFGGSRVGTMGGGETMGGGGLSASQRLPNVAFDKPKALKPAIVPAVVRSATSPLAELAGLDVPRRGYGVKFRTAFAEGGGAWTRKEGQNPKGGLNAVGRASLKAQGHDIKPPVSAKQAKKSPKAAARRKSFCARMSGMPGAMKDDNGKPTRKALALRKWDCKAKGGMVEGYAEGGASRVNEAGNYTKPGMRKRLFESIKSGGSGGAPGQWSARKAQMLAKKYKESGGGYK